MRTVKHKALPLNAAKQGNLDELCRAYACEKRYWIQFLQSWTHQAHLDTPRKIRDQMIQQGYHSPYGLQARHWKLALTDAVETWDKYWQALFIKVRSKIACHITEDLSHTFVYDKSKKVNRKLSSWLRGKLQDRISFKALAEGFRHEQVNPAYGSQSCPSCEFVDYRNRTGDHFKCLYCGHEGRADRVAALNYARRYGDHEIGQYTPYRQVKTILLGRFHRRLEAEQSVTVPGRTLDTVVEINPLPLSRYLKNHSRERKSRKTERSLRERNKINTF
jgi:IS605 OrfB family transposase